MSDTDLGADPEEAFGLVANELRFEIVEALWNAETDDERPLSFSDLRERVGLRDSGQFNYHLDKLTPRFVRKVAEGYELTYAGKQVVGAAVSGTYTDADVTIDPHVVGSCPACEAPVELAYESGAIVIECTECDLSITDGMPAPPVLAAHNDQADLPAVFTGLLRSRLVTINEGVCTLCGGPIDSTPLPFADSEMSFDPGEGHVGVAHHCRVCDREAHSAIDLTVVEHPAVVALLHERGVDVRALPLWEMDWLGDDTATVESEDPPRVRVDVERGGERVRLHVDDDCEVVDYERETV